MHGLGEYVETSEELERLKKSIEDAPTRSQKQEMEKLLERVQCRQDAIRSAAVVLFDRLGGKVDFDIDEKFGITAQDRARVSSGLINNLKSPAHEVVRFLVEEAQSDFISGRA